MWHLPAAATWTKPSSFNKETQTCQFIDEEWIVADIPEPEPEPEPEPIPAMDQLRSQRNALLAETDWWASSDLTMTADQTAYRKALRDLPGTATPELDSKKNLIGVDWPTKPE